jgi:hypothetical protein
MGSATKSNSAVAAFEKVCIPLLQSIRQISLGVRELGGAVSNGDSGSARRDKNESELTGKALERDRLVY